MSVEKAIHDRRSTRKYDPKPVPKELIEKILEGARLAPSARNLQPWYFFVVNDLERNKKIGCEIEVNLIKDHPEYKDSSLHTGLSNVVFYDSPCVIYCAYRKDGINYKEFDLGIAVENMMLVAEELGLGTVPVGYAYHYGKDIVTKELGIPEEYQFFLSLCVGYPHESVKRSEKTRTECCWKFL